MYTISYDRMKRQLAGYDRTKDGPLIDDLSMGLFELVCRKQIPILLDFYFVSETGYLACRNVAEQNGYIFIDLELTAPMPVLLERFHERRQESGPLGTEALNMTEEGFVERAERKFYFPQGTPVFDTSKISPEKISEEIIGRILPSKAR